MNKRYLILLVAVVFAISPFIASANNELVIKTQLFTLGHAERTYQDGYITCYLGTLFPGQPIYWCMKPDGSMDHSWFVYQNQDMNKYYTGSPTGTYTTTPKGRLN